jgi:hypothetical protein
MMIAFFKTPRLEQQMLIEWMHERPLVVRIHPDPPVTSSLAYARIRYELTGQRQWIVAPTLELLD